MWTPFRARLGSCPSVPDSNADRTAMFSRRGGAKRPAPQGTRTKSSCSAQQNGLVRGMRLGGFEPPTVGLEVRCSSAELQAPAEQGNPFPGKSRRRRIDGAHLEAS